MCPPPSSSDEDLSFLPYQNSSYLSHINNNELYQPINPLNDFDDKSELYQPMYSPKDFNQNLSYFSYGSTSSLPYTNTNVYQAMSIQESWVHHPEANGLYQPLTNTDVYQAMSIQESSVYHPAANTQYQAMTNTDVHHGARNEEFQPMIFPGSVPNHEASNDHNQPKIIQESLGLPHQASNDEYQSTIIQDSLGQNQAANEHYQLVNIQRSFSHHEAANEQYQPIIIQESFEQYQSEHEPQPPLSIQRSFGQLEATNEQYQPMIVKGSFEHHQAAIEQLYMNHEEFANSTIEPPQPPHPQHMELHRAGDEDNQVAELLGDKRRLRWTGELHARFLSAVNELGGLYRATPKVILLKMDVRGLTNDHIKSHLQKTRNYMNRSNISAAQTDTQSNPHGSAQQLSQGEGYFNGSDDQSSDAYKRGYEQLM